MRGGGAGGGNADRDITVPVHAWADRRLAEQTDVESFSVLQPKADGLQYLRAGGEKPPPGACSTGPTLHLTAPEMTVLVGGMRALGANVGGTSHGVLDRRPA